MNHNRFMSADPKFNWPSWGSGLANTRFAENENKLSPQNVASVVVKKGWPVQVESLKLTSA